MSRKQKMKVYHGVPKSIIDEHTIFYASFDTSMVPEFTKVSSYNFPMHNSLINLSSPIGGSIGIKQNEPRVYPYISIPFEDVLTIELWNNSSNVRFIGLSSSNNILSNYNYILNIRPDGIIYWGNNGQPNTILYKNNDYNHIRIVFYKNSNNIKVYLNGKCNSFIVSENHKRFLYQDYLHIKLFDCYGMGDTQGSRLSKGISDLHISNIDRGDYFPNLPQDFIDGKAIIKPRMGQQQIKGDPMYSQVTTIKVPSHIDGDWSLYNPVPTNGAHQSYNNPELSIAGGTNWSSGSLIRLTGLNGEVISGVIDNETALATVTLSAMAPITKLQCNSVSGFIVGDTITIYDPVSKDSTYEKIIRSVDVETKTITLDSVLNGPGGNWNVTANKHLIIETTSSSSSPIVKTKEGTKVAGTWSGLGTTVATFTLGNNNPSLQGKDIYVEYALTMPCGNSDFSELPYTVEKAWGENGVEMKPVSEIIITDDFKGKIKGSNKECPHSVYHCLMNSLQHVDKISSDNIALGFVEILSQSNIYNIGSPHDNKLCASGVTKDKVIPQQLFRFNIIEMVERKLGCEIPSKDKVQWLKENFKTARVYYTGYGKSHVGNKAYITIYDQLNKNWLPDWVTFTSSSATTINGAFKYEHYDRIIPNGILYVLAYTDPSNGNDSSTIYTDYISVEITLKTDSTYTTLYCENTRAREDKCNPVLVQKETKTVKRYLPSKECFTTECKYVDMPRSVLSASDLFNYHHKGTKIYSTTRGSGMYSQYTGIYPNIINLLKIADYNAHTYLNDGLKDSPVTARFYMSFTEQLGESYAGNSLSGMPTEQYDLPKYIQIIPYIRLNNGELELMIYTSEIVDTTNNIYNPKSMTKEYILAYKIPYRPLIK